MPLTHTLLALAVVFVWGTNFVPIKFGLEEFPPFAFATLRFIIAVVPWILVVPRPKVAIRWLAMFGLLTGPGQFGLLYYAMQRDISPGLASLLMQCQVLITLVVAAAWFHEKIAKASLVGLLLTAIGFVFIAQHTGATVTLKGLFVILLAASCWAGGNLLVKQAGLVTPQRINMLQFMIWSSLFAVPPLIALTVAFEGTQVLSAARSATWVGWSAVVWQAVGNTLAGFGIWNWLLMRHRADLVTPFALLVPVFGMTASALVAGESMPMWKVQGAILILAGLAVHVFSPLFERFVSSGRTRLKI
ncbi:EamA family transporter [Rhizobacter sp. Root404]|uniref:EamA family transporter n=1 Tax=Rhizobacter sp. Root404 TaxID=1736528 RepID=UPI0006F2C7B7|nr:EamA family transporter [Rhizobacter sp. Root404]KQW38400.1 hypothetical protein ASC76_10280 [Rhizobacter sp. Root404]